MATDPAVDALVRITPPEHDAGETVDWAAVAAELGTGLPADYRDFLVVYGGGSFGGHLSILLPLPPSDPPLWEPGVLAGETANLRHMWSREGQVLDTGLGADAVLAWGVGSANPDLLGWLMTGPDSDRWPVVVWRRHVSSGETSFALFECGMAAFLARLMLAEFGTCPLSDVSLWGRPTPFVHWREEQRRYAAGLDPVTGEPDPYADTFPRPTDLR